MVLLVSTICVMNMYNIATWNCNVCLNPLINKTTKSMSICGQLILKETKHLIKEIHLTILVIEWIASFPSTGKFEHFKWCRYIFASPWNNLFIWTNPFPNNWIIRIYLCSSSVAVNMNSKAEIYIYLCLIVFFSSLPHRSVYIKKW